MTDVWRLTISHIFFCVARILHFSFCPPPPPPPPPSPISHYFFIVFLFSPTLPNFHLKSCHCWISNALFYTFALTLLSSHHLSLSLSDFYLGLYIFLKLSSCSLPLLISLLLVGLFLSLLPLWYNLNLSLSLSTMWCLKKLGNFWHFPYRVSKFVDENTKPYFKRKYFFFKSNTAEYY